MSILRALGINPRHQKVADSHITEGSVLDSSPFGAHKPALLLKHPGALVPLRMNLSGCISNPAIPSPPNTAECYTTQPNSLVSSSGPISGSRVQDHFFMSNFPAQLSDSAGDAWRRANPGQLSLPTFPTSLQNQPIDNDEAKLSEPNRPSLEYSVRALPGDKNLVFNHVKDSPSKQLNSTIGGQDSSNDGAEIPASRVIHLQSSLKALTINELTDRNNSEELPYEELAFTYPPENVTNVYNPPQRLQSSLAWCGLHMAPRGGRLLNSSCSLRLERDSYSLSARKNPSRFHYSENSHSVLSSRERQFPAPTPHVVAPSVHVLSRSENHSSNKRESSSVLKNVQLATCCPGALPRSGVSYQQHHLDEPSHQRPILPEPSHQRYLVDEVQTSVEIAQRATKLAMRRSVSQQDLCEPQALKKSKAHSLSSRDLSSCDRVSHQRHSGNKNHYTNSTALQKRHSCEADVEILSKRHSCEADVEILSPLLRDILQIMADHGQCISKPLVPIEFPIEKESIMDQSRQKPSKPFIESELSSNKPLSTFNRVPHMSNGSCTKQPDESSSELGSRSSPGSFSFRKFSGIESCLKKNSLFVRPSTAGSIPRSNSNVRKRHDLGKTTHYSDPNPDRGQDSLVDKSQKFEALLKASDASNGGTIKMSLSSKIDHMSDSEDLPSTTLQAPLNLNPQLISLTNNWFGSLKSSRSSCNHTIDDNFILGRS